MLAAAVVFAAGSMAAQEPADDPFAVQDPSDPAVEEGAGEPGTATDPGGLEAGEPVVPPIGGEAEDELPEGGTPAFVASVLSAGAARDDGILAGGEAIEDTSYSVIPTLLFLHRPSERTELAIGYEPEIESFAEHTELDAVHHAAGVVFRHQASESWAVGFGGSLLDGEDPSRHLDGLILLLPRSPYRQARGYVDLERRWRYTALLLHVGRTTTEIAPSEGLLDTGIDQTDDVAALSLEQALGVRTTLSLNYSYVDPTPGRDAVVPEGVLPAALTEPIQTALLGISRRVTRRVTLDLAAGLVDDGLEPAEGEDRYDYLASGEIRRSDDEFAWRLRYDRALLSLAPSVAAPGAPAGTALTGAALLDSIAHTVTAGFDLSPGPWVRWHQLVRATRAEFEDGDDLETLALTSRLTVPATRRFGVYAQIDHFEHGAGAGADDLSRTRYGVGLVVGITGPPAAWGIREEPALLLRTLRPDRY